MDDEPITAEQLSDNLIGRAGWICPTCVPRSVSVRVDKLGIDVRIAHGPRCPDAARWLVAPVPDLQDPERGER